MSTALILVRNGVTHDARVLREAQTLQSLGYQTLIAGVVSSQDPEQEVVIEGVRAVRLDPAGALGGLRRTINRRPAPVTGTSSAPGPGGGAPHGRSRPRRLAVTAAYYCQGLQLILSTRPALVHANDYNTMWIGIAAKVLGRSRLIYDCHELWPDRNGRPEWRPWLLFCEALFVRAADATITTSPGYAEVIATRYRVPRPVVVRNIPRGWSQPPARESSGADGLGVYIGGLMPGRGLEEAIAALAFAPEIRLRLIGPGHEAYRVGLMDLARREGVSDRVEISPPVSPGELLSTIASGDFGLMVIQPVCLSYELTLPNKLFEYAAAGLPMLASDLPVIAQTVEEHELGLVVPAGDLERIALAMQELCRPAINRGFRKTVGAFAEATTWNRERSVLASVYVPDGTSEHDRVHASYAAYATSPGKQRSWNAGNPGNAAIRSELVESVFAVAADQLRRARLILDAGCGTGWWLEELDRRDEITAELHGVDVLQERVATAGRRVPAARITTADVRSLPHDADTFDLVTLFTVLSSLAGPDDIRRALGEARRVLRPGGALIIWEPRIANPFNRRTILVSDSILDDGLAGMTVERRTTTVLPALSRRLGHRAIPLYPRLAQLGPLRTHRLVCARAAY